MAESNGLPSELTVGGSVLKLAEPRSQERKLVKIDVDRQVHLAIRSFNSRDQELSLQIEQLQVSRNLSLSYIEGMLIAQVAVAIQVTRLPDSTARGTDQDDVEPQLRLSSSEPLGMLCPSL